MSSKSDRDTRLTYVASTTDGRTFECRGNHVGQALRNLAMRHPELIGRQVRFGSAYEWETLREPSHYESIR